MAKVEIIKESEFEDKSVIIGHVIVQSPDRTPKDIADWIRAMEAAEQVYHPQRVLLLDLYARLELDGHFTGVWEKRIAQVINKKLRFARKKDKDDSFDTLIESDMFRNFIRMRLEYKSHGLRGAEFIPGPQFHWIEIPPKHIKPEKRIISREQYQETGIEYDGVWNLYVMGSSKEKGFLLKCAPYILWKQGVFGDWAQFIEIFGQPARLFKYDVYDEKTKKEAADLQKNAGASMSMVIPKQMDFEMLDGKTSNGNGDLQDKFRKACNEEISVIVLGSTETTTSSRTSGYAQAETHADQQEEIILSDMQEVLNTLNDPKFLRILQSYGYNVAGGRFEYEEEEDLDHLIKKKSLILDLKSKGLPIDDDYLYETFGIPKPANYKQQKTEMERQRQAREAAEPGSPKPKKEPPPNQAADPDLGLWDKFLSRLSDFFDPAR